MKARGRISRQSDGVVVVLEDECDLADGTRVVVNEEAPAGEKPVHPNGWSAEFLASLGSIDEEIPRPPHRRLKRRDPFDR